MLIDIAIGSPVALMIALLISIGFACFFMAWRILTAPTPSFELLGGLSGNFSETLQGKLASIDDHQEILTVRSLAFDLKNNNWVDEGRLSDEAVDSAHAR